MNHEKSACSALYAPGTAAATCKQGRSIGWRALQLVVMAMSLPFACRDFQAKAPEGFARYEDSTLGLPAREFRAISADGVRFRVKAVRNEPAGDAVLWTAALRRSLERKGYRLSESASLRTEDGHDLVVIHGVVGLGGVDYGYALGFSVHDDTVVIAEAGGPQEAMVLHAKEIDAAFRSVKIP